MTYQPVIPFSGFAGWRFLSRTMETQKAAFAASSENQRLDRYFRETIGSIDTAQELVDDRRLLSVALGAFGLDADIDNKYFIRKVLEEGSLDRTALANKLSDKSYLALTKAFGFGDFAIPRTKLSTFADEILNQFESREFEVAVGGVDNDMRMAMSLQRDLPALAARDMSEPAKWYTIIGSPALSRVFQTALNLPPSVGALDVEQQRDIYMSKAQRVYGTSDSAELAAPEKLAALTRDYLLRAQLSNMASVSPQNVALSLLRNTGAQGLSLRL
ncbi:flagellar protein [Thioclava sp. F42-5]|uniref:DUF1217 domain-containing protein n=1 Tax=Thioclava sp. F42-5 TaxID=1973005 RepID=UPI000B53A964|nr:DUF1217 domain-containing protein [Thioclava sp. F42-5]OWY07730.1 flagellar protein [Thioclava sp. F42-5]